MPAFPDDKLAARRRRRRRPLGQPTVDPIVSAQQDAILGFWERFKKAHELPEDLPLGTIQGRPITDPIQIVQQYYSQLADKAVADRQAKRLKKQRDRRDGGGDGDNPRASYGYGDFGSLFLTDETAASDDDGDLYAGRETDVADAEFAEAADGASGPASGRYLPPHHIMVDPPRQDWGDLLSQPAPLKMADTDPRRRRTAPVGSLDRYVPPHIEAAAGAADTDRLQPLGGRPNRNNANLDSVALGQAGIEAGSPAGPPPVLPPEVETIEDYRRLMETGSVSGDVPPAHAFELANRAGSHIAGGILAQAGPGGGQPPDEDPEDPTEEPEEETPTTFGQTIDNISGLGNVTRAAAGAVKPRTAEIDGLRDVKISGLVKDKTAAADIESAEGERDAGLDLLGAVGESLEGKEDSAVRAGTDMNSQKYKDNIAGGMAAGRAISEYVRDKHLEAIATVIANDSEKEEELRKEFIAAAGGDLSPQKAHDLLVALDKLFPEVAEDSDLATARAALAKTAARVTQTTLDPEAAVTGLTSQRKELNKDFQETQRDIKSVNRQISGIQRSLEIINEGVGKKQPTTRQARRLEQLKKELASLNQRLTGTDDAPGLMAQLRKQKAFIRTIDTVIEYYEEPEPD